MNLRLKQLFYQHQLELTLLADSPMGRSLLDIRDDLPVVKLSPNSYHQKLPDGKYKATFFTFDRVAEKLLDYLSTPRISSAPNFYQQMRYAYLDFTPPATGERQGNPTASALWANVRDASSSTQNFALGEVGTSFDTSTYQVYRTWEPFDTSSLTSGVTVDSHTFDFWRDDSVERGGNGFQNGSTTTIKLAPSNQGDPTAYANSDFGLVSFTDKGSLAFASTTNGQYNSITGTDQSQVSLTGYTKYVLMTGLDLSNTQPLATTNYLSWQTRGATNPAKLVVVYHNNSSIKTVNGLAKASVKTVNGLAIASVKKINGLA